MLGEIRDHLLRQAFFHVGEFLIDAKLLPQRFHRQQVLTANGVVVDAGIKIRKLNRDIDGGHRVGADEMYFGMVNFLRQRQRFPNQLFVQGVVIILFAGEIDRDQRFATFRPRLVFYHPHRAGTLTQQVPVGGGEDHCLQFVVLVGHLQQQVVFLANNFLNNGFEGAVVPHHFYVDRHTRFNIEFRLLAYPGCTLGNNALAHRRAFVRRQQGGHFIRKIIDRQKGFDASTNPLVQVHRAPKCRLVVLVRIDYYQHALILRHTGSPYNCSYRQLLKR